MLLQPTDKCAGNVSEFLQKDYKLLHFRFRRFGVRLVFFEKFFQEYIKRKTPRAAFAGAGSSFFAFLQFQQCLCNVEIHQQRGGIHNGGDQG